MRAKTLEEFKHLSGAEQASFLLEAIAENVIDVEFCFAVLDTDLQTKKLIFQAHCRNFNRDGSVLHMLESMSLSEEENASLAEYAITIINDPKQINRTASRLRLLGKYLSEKRRNEMQIVIEHYVSQNRLREHFGFH